MGGGSILTGLTLAAIATFIDRTGIHEGRRRSRFAGAVLTYFGFMHGPAVGIGSTASASRPASRSPI